MQNVGFIINYNNNNDNLSVQTCSGAIARNLEKPRLGDLEQQQPLDNLRQPHGHWGRGRVDVRREEASHNGTVAEGGRPGLVARFPSKSRHCQAVAQSAQ